MSGLQVYAGPSRSYSVRQFVPKKPARHRGFLIPGENNAGSVMNIEAWRARKAFAQQEVERVKTLAAAEAFLSDLAQEEWVWPNEENLVDVDAEVFMKDQFDAMRQLGE